MDCLRDRKGNSKLQLRKVVGRSFSFDSVANVFLEIKCYSVTTLQKHLAVGTPSCAQIWQQRYSKLKTFHKLPGRRTQQ